MHSSELFQKNNNKKVEFPTDCIYKTYKIAKGAKVGSSPTFYTY